jgi:hypothetical protein
MIEPTKHHAGQNRVGSRISLSLDPILNHRDDRTRWSNRTIGLGRRSASLSGNAAAPMAAMAQNPCPHPAPDVVKTNTFVTDFDEFQKCADIRMRDLGVVTPTSTTVGVTRLAGPDFMIEIEAVAVVNS